MVSVIIAAYDVSTIISRAIQSALAQSLPAYEIIVVDDGSKDQTGEVVRKLAEENPQIKLITLSDNGGPGRARNVGIESARGDWVAILDADDSWRPTRLERLIAVAEEHQADFIADNQIYFDSFANREGSFGFKVDWPYKVTDVEDLFLNDIIEVVPFSYGNLQPMLRRKFLLDTGLRYDEKLRFGEDFKLYAELFFHGAKAIITSEAYYVHSTRIGEFSRKRATHSKTRARFDVLIETSDQLKEKYKDKITPGIARAMELRNKQLRLIHLANIAREFRHQRRYFKYLSYLMQHPDLVWLLAKRVTKRLLTGFR